MRSLSPQQILAKIQSANPWWNSGDRTVSLVPFHNLRSRRYFHLFKKLAVKRLPVRALLLMGPRRVGKTVLAFHLIRWLINRGHDPKKIFYLDLQQPLYNGQGLEQLLEFSQQASGVSSTSDLYVIFDEVQYLRDWEVHLKALVDSYPSIKFIATGSAAAALRLKSTESGAGRFTDFLLPPVTFYEYMDLLGKNGLVHIARRHRKTKASSRDITSLNKHFIDYLNCGGYPEAIFSDEIKADMERFIRSDIIDKVLLKDLPSLYGIQDIQELNSLFTVLAYNTAHEVSLNQLSQNSGVAKNTIKRYIDYLQSAFLIRVVHRVDCNAKRFQRANFFKVYLTNPSMRSALFSPLTENDDDMGDMVETAVFSQWFHSIYSELHYARWKDGEVDIVYLGPKLKPLWAIEVKWSDRFEERPEELKSLHEFCERNPKCTVKVTTRTKQSSKAVGGVDIAFLPASLYCYMLGYNIITGKQRWFDIVARISPADNSNEETSRPVAKNETPPPSGQE
jgi:predicted AAA+ superfamily ATPase